jgi:uncharacterized protein YrrD
MLNKTNTLKGYKLHSLDGEIGKVKEFFFDDHHWTIRYLVADTGDWLTGRLVLISPYALVGVDKEEQFITVDLTKKQIEDSPTMSSDLPVSRQSEETYFGYYGYPVYWRGSFPWGPYRNILHDREKLKTANTGGKVQDSHLRSTQEVCGYHIHASDGEIGHIDDFIFDDEAWTIRYLIIDTRNWLPGKKVLISPKWIERISWDSSKVFVNLTRESVKQSPTYSEESLPTRDDETKLHRHYNRQGYWVDEPDAKEHLGKRK